MDRSTTDLFSQLAQDIASTIPSIDSKIEGQYGSRIGSESEERQVKLVLDELQSHDSYLDTEREIPYPSRSAKCDLLLEGRIPVEAKGLPEKFEASELAEKVVEDIEYWYEFEMLKFAR